MHTGILLAVEAEDADVALSIATDFAERQDWSDWNEHQGRWEGQIPNGVLCYTDDPELFNSVVDLYVEMTNSEELDLLKDVGHLSIEELISDPRYFFNWHATPEELEEEQNSLLTLTEEERKARSGDKFHQYRAFKLLNINQNHCAPETHFYDVDEYTRSSIPLKKRLVSSPDKQYIVMWDFHY